LKASTPRFKAIILTIAFSFWFTILSPTFNLGYWSIQSFVIFVIITFVITQILAFRLSKVLDIVAKYNTKIFLSLLYVGLFIPYGILFKALKIDMMRLNNKEKSFWLEIDTSKSLILKQYGS